MSFLYNNLVKLLIIGNSGVGKSSLLERFTENQFSEDYIYTIGVDFKVRYIQSEEGQRIKIQIWDTAGQERFRTFTNSYFRGAHGVIIVYDMTDWMSFNAVNNWIKDITRFSGEKQLIKILIGNKNDQIDQRVIHWEVAKELAAEYDMTFVEASAKTGSNVEYAFQLITSQILMRLSIQNNYSQLTKSGIRLNCKESKREENFCCQLQ